jgi:hypothetical protein
MARRNNAGCQAARLAPNDHRGRGGPLPGAVDLKRPGPDVWEHEPKRIVPENVGDSKWADRAFASGCRTSKSDLKQHVGC